MDVYTPLKENFAAGLQSMERGNPAATPEAIFKIADTETPPLRFFLGNQALPWTRKAYDERLAVWESWASVSDAAQG